MTSSARLQQEADAARAGLSSALDDLKNSVTTTALTNGAMTFAKEGSSAVAKAAVDRAAANPLAAMLIGAGLFMLLSTRKDGSSPLGDLVHSGTSAVKSAVDRVSDSTVQAANDASGTFSGTAEHATSQAKDMLAKGQEQVQDLTDKGREQLHDLASQGRQQMHDLRDKGRESAQKLLDQGRSTFDQLANDQPILVAALGVALGAALGAAIPISRAEQEYLGDAARLARRKGEAVAGQVADAVTGHLAGDDAARKVGEVVETASNAVAQSLRSS
jgi:ElaB/YqjD/DUF883 family membrane-anchored ribosome-binding protein